MVLRPECCSAEIHCASIFALQDGQFSRFWGFAVLRQQLELLVIVRTILIDTSLMLFYTMHCVMVILFCTLTNQLSMSILTWNLEYLFSSMASSPWIATRTTIIFPHPPAYHPKCRPSLRPYLGANCLLDPGSFTTQNIQPMTDVIGRYSKWPRVW